MAKYREYSPKQTRLLPVALSNQIQPGTIEFSINYLVDHHIDLSVFDSRYNNDETGAPAIDPAILLKVILFAYSRGIISSRRIAQSCEMNPATLHNDRWVHLLDVRGDHLGVSRYSHRLLCRRADRQTDVRGGRMQDLFQLLQGVERHEEGAFEEGRED